jgi:hypothetical protein
MPHIIRTDDDCLEAVYESNRRQNRAVHLEPLGCLPRLTPYGHALGAIRSQTVYKRIPRSVWPRLIEEGQGSWLSDLRKGKLPPHDQNGTPLCWAHGSVRAVEILRIYQGQQPLLLSAEQVAYVATHGRMRGGMPEEALAVLRQVGTCNQNLWPLNSLNERRANPAYETDRENHVVLDWLDIENFDDQMTLALNRVPVAIGLAWWGHLVCQLDPIYFPDGTFGIGYDNSWGTDFGDDGYGILHEDKAKADLGAFAPISETFSIT